MTTTETTTIRLFLTDVQKYGLSIASEKFERVGCVGNQTGVLAMMSPPGLNAVATIQ